MGDPGLSGVGFFCFVSSRAWKQKKPTPLDRGPPLHVNRPLIRQSNLLEPLVSTWNCSEREGGTSELCSLRWCFQIDDDFCFTIFYSLAALVRKILFCHSKMKFISSSHRVMFFLLYRQNDIDKIIEGNYLNYIIDKLMCEIMENKPLGSRM